MEWLSDGLYKAAEWALSFLPNSPFAFLHDMAADAEMTMYLKWVNWFIPVGAMVQIFAAWCAAILIYYVYQIVLRWAKAIE